MYVAYGKVYGLVTIICTMFVMFVDEGALREKAQDVIYGLGADDDYKDDLRKTLSILPLHEFIRMNDLSFEESVPS